MVIVSQMVPLRERGKYVGVLYARSAIATVLGPVRCISLKSFGGANMVLLGAWWLVHKVQLAVVLLD